MASFFNMKGTTQSEFMIGIKGPKLTKHVIIDGSAVATTYLLLPNDVIGKKIILNQLDTSKYIDASNYTGNAATATALSAKNIGLSITGLTISQTDDDFSDGTTSISGTLTSVDASKLALGANNAGVPYTVLAGLVASGDLSNNNDDNKIASSQHTHSQYLSTESFTLSTKDDQTELGDIKIGTANETYSVTGSTALLTLNIRNGAILADHISANAVTENKINNGAVTLTKIADGAIKPEKLKAIDANNGYNETDADYSSRIGIVKSAYNLLANGKIAGISISNFLVKDANSTDYTNKVKNAELADTALGIKDNASGNTKTGAAVITAVNTVSAASATLSNGNLVVWSEEGIIGNISGNAATATSASKLANIATLWGNKFNGANTNDGTNVTSINIGTSNGAANIQYTGNITPHTTSQSNIGTSELKYNNIYLAGQMNSLNAKVDNKITLRLLEIDNSSNTESETGINVNYRTVRNASKITVKQILPYGTTSADGTIGSSELPFHSLWMDDSAHIWWTEDNNSVNLKTKLQGKSDVGHTHSIASLTDTIQTETIDGVQVQKTYINNIALSGHKHTMSDITDISGVYQFKGTISENQIATNSATKEIEVSTGTTPHRGDVYNVLVPFDYLDKTYPAGTNIVYEVDLTADDPPLEVGKWKPLGGVFNIDLDGFVTGLTMNHFRSTGMLDADYTTWAENPVATAAGSITTDVWYKARNVDHHDTVTAYFPKASATSYGLLKLGYTQNEKKYPVELDSNTGQAFVNVGWINRDTIDTYSIIAAKNDSDQSNSSDYYGENTNNFVYLNFKHRHQENTGDNTHGEYTDSIEKSIKVQGNGQAKVNYKYASAADKAELTVDVPRRAGYHIPMLYCRVEPQISGGNNWIYYEAGPVSGTNNGLLQDYTDPIAIKNNSLVLLYIEHVERIYENFNANRVPCYIHIPAGYFSFEKDSVYKVQYEYDETPIPFLLTHTTNSAGIGTNVSDIFDMSQKLFLCHLSMAREGDNVDLYPSGGVINILDNVGATIDSLELPTVYISNCGNDIILENYNTNNMVAVLSRYAGIAQLKLRTLKINDKNSYTPIPVLDCRIPYVANRGTDKTAVYDDAVSYRSQDLFIYDKDTLLDNIISQSSLGQSLNKIHFKGDAMVTRKHPGITKKQGHITLETFDKNSNMKKYRRDYTKIKFQYVLTFNNNFEFSGKPSCDEITLSKRLSQCFRNKYDMIQLKLNTENIK